MAKNGTFLEVFWIFGKEKIFLGIAKPENTLLALVYIANRCDTPLSQRGR